MISLASRALASPLTGLPDPGMLATVRTLVLSIAALALAWMSRRKNFISGDGFFIRRSP